MLLIEQMRKGDGRAVSKFIEKYYSRLLLFLHNKGVGDTALAEDVSHETLTEFWHKFVNAKIEYDFTYNDAYPYLCRTALNKVAKVWRDNRGSQYVRVELDEIYAEVDKLAAEAWNRDEIYSEKMIEYMRNDKVFDEICRKIFSLKCPGLNLENLAEVLNEDEHMAIRSDKSFSDKQIAQIMNHWLGNDTEYNENSLRVKRNRCKKSLKEALRRDGYTD